jgi:hypothetical protein
MRQEESKNSIKLQQDDEPVNFVIHCNKDVKRLEKFREHMDRAGLSFEVFPCALVNTSVIQQAIDEGYFSRFAQAHGENKMGFMGVALAHMRLLQTIVDLKLPSANIFEDDSVVTNTYAKDRNALIQSLPADAEFVNLNPNLQGGDPVPGADPRLLRMGPGNAPCEHCNYWMGNYYVRGDAAQKVLTHLRNYDPLREIDAVLKDAVIGGAPINAYVYSHNYLSVQCAVDSTKDDRNKQKVLLQASEEKRDLAARCCFGEVEECTHYPDD